MSPLALLEQPEGPQDPQMSPEAARDLTDRLRGVLEVAYGLLLEAYQGRAHTALGYRTWDAYCAAEFAGARMIRLPRDQRRALVAELSQGMPNRAIATGLGLSEGTVRGDLRLVRSAGAVEAVDPPMGQDPLDGAAEAPEVVVGEVVEPAPVRKTDTALLDLLAAGRDGLTWVDLARLRGWHHGQASGTLSRLHAAGRIALLQDVRRDRSAVYVHHDHAA